MLAPCHLGAALAIPGDFHPVTAKPERVLGEGEGIPLLCLCLFLSSLSRHWISRGDRLRVFQFCVTKGPSPQQPWSYSSGVWGRIAQCQLKLGNMFAQILSAVSQAPRIPSLLPPGQTAGCGSRTSRAAGGNQARPFPG